MKNQLGWLRGFPSAGRRWMCVPEPGSERPIEEIVVGPRHLQSATRALHTLLREHRAALAELVDDVARWQDGTKAVLAALDAYVHRGAAIDVVALLGAVQGGRNARLLASADARVVPLMTALAFLHLREPRELKKCFACIERAATALTGILAIETEQPLALAVRLVDVAREDGAGRLLPLFERLGDARSHSVALGSSGSGAIVVTERRKGRTRAWPDKNQVNLGPALVAFASRLPSWDAPRRRRTLSLWSLVDPAPVVDGWAKLWTRYEALVREAEELLPHARVPRASRRLTALQRAFKRLDDTKPSALDGASLVRAVEALGAAPAETCTAVARVLARLPLHRGRMLLRAHMLFVYEHVLTDAAHTELCARELERLISEVGDVDIAMAPWHESIKGALYVPTRRERSSPEVDLDSEPAAVVRTFFAALRAGYAREGSAIAASWRERARLLTLQTLAQLTRDGARADRLFGQLIAAGTAAVRDVVLKTALDLTQDDDERFAALVQTLDRALAGETEFDEEDALGLVWTRHDPAVTRRIADWLLNGEARGIRRVGGRARVLRTLKASPPYPPAVHEADDAEWMDRYPAALRAPLRRLASVDPRARESAARVLGKSYPDPQALHREARALRERLAAASGERARRMRARLGNLEARLRAPKASANVDEQARELGALTERRALRAWEQALDAALFEALVPLLGVETLPSWALEPPCIDLLPHLCALEAPSNKLAFRVLRARAGPYPWDLRDEPKNRAFIAELTRRGIDVAPWIDGIGLLSQRTERGVVYLQLERDPLEALLMGQHFETCLSPGWFNFFSAVSNTADINKRVLYGRDNEGTVVGRCLLALTDEGAMLAFHPYCHDEGWQFSKLVSDFVNRLCERMGTQPAPHGTVSNLLCNRWYDDGPVDVTGRFAWTRQNSAGFQRILESTPDEVVAVVREVIRPLELNALTLPMVIGMFEGRAELAVPFVAVVRSTPELGLAVKLRVAELAWRAGAREPVSELVSELLGDIERRRITVSGRTLELLLDVGEAALVLRVLKRTRARGVRSLEQEIDVERLLAAARACEILHRKSRARALYQRALPRCYAPHLRERCEARLAVLCC